MNWTARPLQAWVAKTLAKKGMLKAEAGGKRQKLVRVPGSGNPVHCYVIPAAILGGLTC